MAEHPLTGALEGMLLVDDEEHVSFDPPTTIRRLDGDWPWDAANSLGRWVAIETDSTVRFGYGEWPGPKVDIAGAPPDEVHWVSEGEAVLLRTLDVASGARFGRLEPVACWMRVDGAMGDAIALGPWLQGVLPVGDGFLLASFIDQGYAQPPFGGGVVLVDRRGQVVHRISTLESYGMCRTPDRGALVFTLGMESAQVLAPDGRWKATFEVPPALAYGHAPSMTRFEGRHFVTCCAHPGGVALWEVGTTAASVVADLAAPRMRPSAGGRYIRPVDDGVHIRRFGVIAR